MRTPAYLCLLLTCMLISCTSTQEKHEIDYTSYVNPFIGTDFTGNTYPGAQAPFGMVQLSPDNGLPGWDRISGYFYPDSTIAGFSHTHLSGTGAGDLYDISFMPVSIGLPLSILPATKNRFSVISPRSWKAIFFTTSAGSGAQNLTTLMP